MPNDTQTTQETPIANLNICPLCFGCGFCSIDRYGLPIPLEPGHKINNRLRGVRMCRNCDYWEYRMRKVRG